ncbi:MAG: FHA domain-containing protein [Candidatus Promineifilaceae bacterium]
MILRTELAPDGQTHPLEFELDGERLTLGRTDINEICLPDKEVSRRHAAFICQDGSWSLYDLGSSNGTFLNGLKLVPKTAYPMHHGHHLRIGTYEFSVVQPERGAVIANSAEMPLSLPPEIELPTDAEILELALQAVPDPDPDPDPDPIAPPVSVDAPLLPVENLQPQPVGKNWQPMLRWVLPMLAIGLILIAGALIWRNQGAASDGQTGGTQTGNGAVVGSTSGLIVNPEAYPADIVLESVVPTIGAAERLDSAEVENLLINGSFENGAVEQDGWQVPLDWTVIGTGADDGSMYVGIVENGMLAPSDRNRFAIDQEHALRISAEGVPMGARVFSTQQLPAGNYRLSVKVVPEIVVNIKRDGPEYPTDPTAAEVRLLAPGEAEWQSVAYGLQNNVGHQFELSVPGTILMGIEVRATQPYELNGWILDNFVLTRMER